MKSALSLTLLLLAVAIGPLAIVTFMPLLNAVQLQPILFFGGICFGAGCVATALAVMGATMTHEVIENHEYKEIPDASKSV
jgi:hypothetical protein